MSEPVYLASPYTNYYKGRPGAYLDACKIAAAINRKYGYRIFSPIPNCHGMTTIPEGLPQIDHDFWENYNRPFMAICGGLIIAMLDGWRDSRGIKYEEREFRAAQKPILYCDPDTLELAA